MKVCGVRKTVGAWLWSLIAESLRPIACFVSMQTQKLFMSLIIISMFYVGMSFSVYASSLESLSSDIILSVLEEITKEG